MGGITVLGPVAVGDGGPPLAPRDRVVLSTLVAHRDREVPAEVLAEALWGENRPASWAKVVQGCIARLRRRLGTEGIVTGRHGYRLVVPAEDVDAGRFERLVQRAGELLSLDHADQAAYAADEALALWHGRPLPDLEDWEPGRGEADRLTELRLLAEELRLGALLSSGRHQEALAEAALRVREQPLREHRWALLTRAQYQDGRQAEALATLRRAREVLADELGLDPGPQLVRLEEAVLRQDPSLEVLSAATPSASCPWPGLAPYDVDDADAFFGREDEVRECAARLGRHGFVAVVGPSGSGKSSLARAGLAAALRRQGRRVEVITPGPRPLDALAAARRGPTSVLVVDQCEEVLAPTVPPQVRDRFLTGLAELTSPVVLTLRADRLGELAAYPQVARRVEEGLYLLKGMDEQGLRAAVEGPARQAGLLLEQGLVDLLVRDVQGEPGSLPLLAHALRQTWERRQGTTLTVQAYASTGGIHGAVAQSAEQVYEAATPEMRQALRELLLRMVQAGPGGEPVRTSVAHDSVTVDEAHSVLLEQLVRARLVTTAQDRVEIAHEALARAWPRLQSWLAEDVEGERIRHHLAATAVTWHALGRPASELYRGARLAAAQEWRATGQHRLTAVEREFLASSDEAHRSELARAEAEAHRQRRLNRSLRLLTVGAVVLALLAASLGGAAVLQWQRSRQAELVATVEAERARSHELSASAVAALDTNPALAKALAVAGAQAAPPSVQSTGALHRTYAADRVVSRVSMNHFTGRLWAVLHPDGRRVAMTGESVLDGARALEVHDARTGALVWEWVRPDVPGHESAVMAGAAYSADGSVLVSGVVWDPFAAARIGPPVEESPAPAPGLVGVHLWDGLSHDRLAVLDVGPCGGWPLEVASGHVLVRTLVAASGTLEEESEAARSAAECRWDEGRLGTVLVDRQTGDTRLLGLVPEGASWSFGAALSEDGSVAAAADYGRPRPDTVVVDTSTGEELVRIRDASPHDLDPSGEHVLVLRSGGGADRYQVVSVADGQVVSEFTGHTAPTIYAAFGPGGHTVLSTGMDNVLVEWDAWDGQELYRVSAAGGGRPSGAGERWVLVPRPTTYGAVLVDTGARGEGWAVQACGGPSFADMMRIGADRVVVARECGDPESAMQLQTFDLGGGERDTFPDASSTQALEVSPDGHLFVSQGATPVPDRPPELGPLQVRDLTSGEVVQTLQGFCPHPDGFPAEAGCDLLPQVPFAFNSWRARWSPDGRWIAAVDQGHWRSYSEAVAVWEASTGELVTALATVGTPDRDRWGGVHDLLFSPDSDRLVLTTRHSMIVAVDTATWEPVVERRLEVPNAGSAAPVGYAADGTLVVVSPFRDNVPITSVLLVDPDTLGLRRVDTGVVEGSVRSAAVSPDGTRVAMATSEGSVTVRDLATGDRVDEVDPGLGSLQGVQWQDDRDLTLLARQGSLVTITTDPDRLLAMVQESLTRGLTATECTAYGFDQCPGLTDLNGGGPAVPEDLRGVYTVSWDVAELHEAAVAHYESAFGGALDPAAVAELGLVAEDIAGDYQIEFTDTTYRITRGRGQDEFCAGSVTRSGDRLLLSADRGSWCVDFHYAEVGWVREGGALRLPSEEFRGPWVDALLWTLRPLELVH